MVNYIQLDGKKVVKSIIAPIIKEAFLERKQHPDLQTKAKKYKSCKNKIPEIQPLQVKPWKFNDSKSFAETAATSAAFGHLDEHRENDMPLIQISDGFVLVRTTCKCILNVIIP